VFGRHPGTRIGGPRSVVAAATRLGVEPDRTVEIRAGEPVEVGDIRIESVFARHMFDAEPTPDAVGYLITVGGLRLYHAGDTEYDARIPAETRGRVDVSLVCVNGTTGNMNAHEAALLARDARPWLTPAANTRVARRPRPRSFAVNDDPAGRTALRAAFLMQVRGPLSRRRGRTATARRASAGRRPSLPPRPR